MSSSSLSPRLSYKFSLTHDLWMDYGAAYANSADSWSRIISCLRTLIETGKTFKTH